MFPYWECSWVRDSGLMRVNYLLGHQLSTKLLFWNLEFILCMFTVFSLFPNSVVMSSILCIAGNVLILSWRLKLHRPFLLVTMMRKLMMNNSRWTKKLWVCFWIQWIFKCYTWTVVWQQIIPTMCIVPQVHKIDVIWNHNLLQWLLQYKINKKILTL